MIRIFTIIFYTLAIMGIGATSYTVITELWTHHKIDVVVILFGLLMLANRFGDIVVKTWNDRG